jgi:predicted alpha/beta-fold hydrolase
LTWAYQAPWWLPEGHTQTIYSSLWAQPKASSGVPWQRERWATPDDDFIDVDELLPPQESSDLAGTLPSNTGSRVLCVLFHGLEGSSQSHYARAWAAEARRRRWRLAVPHFRGCSGEINRAPRAYHSGDFEEIGWILSRMRQRHRGPLLAVGVSLGGNALMRWAQEMGRAAAQVVNGVVSVCSPLDLTASGHAIGRGFNRLVYTRMFLNTMKPRALAKLAQYPGLFEREALLHARDLYAFDNVFTAPLHGFKDTDDYWEKASSAPHFQRVQLPTLLINALNDPFVPAHSLPTQEDVSTWVHLWRPRQGGHVGFAQGPFPGHVRGLPSAIASWFEAL